MECKVFGSPRSVERKAESELILILRREGVD